MVAAARAGGLEVRSVTSETDGDCGGQLGRGVGIS